MSAATAPADFQAALAKRQADWFVPGKRGGRKFIPRRAAVGLHAETPVAVGGEALRIHRGGSYVEGEEDLRRRFAETLADDWKRNYADETMTLLRDISPHLWDEPPRDRISVENGILDISDPSAPKLEDHDPQFLSPVQIAAAYDPKATCPAIDQFLSEVLDAECRRLFAEQVGYFVTPDNSLQVAFMYLGGGGNGKSVAIGLHAAVLGRDNVSAVPLHKLEDDRFAASDLYGRLLNQFADLDSRALQASSVFKSITGGDTIRAERKFCPAFAFRPLSS